MEISFSNKSLGEDADLDFLWTSSSSAEQSTNSTLNFSGFGVRLTSTQKLFHILPDPRHIEESNNVMRLTSTQKLSHLLPEPSQNEESDALIMQPTEDIAMVSAVFDDVGGDGLVQSTEPESNSLEDVGGDGLVQPTEDVSMISAGDLENDLESNSLQDVGGDGLVQPTGDPDWYTPVAEPMPKPQITPENDIVRQTVQPRQIPLIDVPTYTYNAVGAQKGGPVVSCSDGHEYYSKDMGKDRQHLDPTWTCKHRPKKGKICTATIRERTSKDGLIYYERNKVAHTTHADSGMNPGKGRKFHSDLKEEAKKNPMTSCAQLYETKLMEIPIEERSTMKSIKSQKVTVRQMNRGKSGTVPKEPAALDFVVDYNFLASCGVIPEGRYFIKEEINMASGKRHFIMYTELMQAIMSDVFTWWVDATFKVVKFPFTQLWGVHAFINCEGSMKQVTVAFVLMSGKSTLDYEAVFEKLKEKCPNNKVNTIVGDFEAATWNGAKNVFKDQIKMKGCYFHFTQAIWRKIVSLKIAGDKEDDDPYHRDEGTRVFCKKMMSLPLLPHEEIKTTYETLKSEINTLGVKLEKLCTYFERTWLNSKLFTPESWSWYGDAIRTNNDVEGYHRRLNTRAGAGGTLTFYKLCVLLGAEAAWIAYQRYEVLNGLLSRRVARRQSEKQAKLFDVWSQYYTYTTSGLNVETFDAMNLINAIWELAEPNKAPELSVLELVVAAEDDTN